MGVGGLQLFGHLEPEAFWHLHNRLVMRLASWLWHRWRWPGCSRLRESDVLPMPVLLVVYLCRLHHGAAFDLILLPVAGTMPHRYSCRRSLRHDAMARVWFTVCCHRFGHCCDSNLQRSGSPGAQSHCTMRCCTCNCSSAILP